MVTAVVIGRFQVPQLTAGHIALLTKAAQYGDRLLVLIGVAPTRGTSRDPLDYAAREAMIAEWWKYWWDAPSMGRAHDLLVMPLPDSAQHIRWVHDVDEAIARLNGPATLFGGRDSCGQCYRLHGGRWPFEEIAMVDPLSGTEVRASVPSQPCNADFRAGMIYASQTKFQTVYPTVDVVIYRKGGDVLLARKANEIRWRLPGGFVEPADHSLEYAAAREAREETGLEIGPPVYVGSSFIADWRYVKGPEAIISAVFLAPYIFGYAQARDDIAEVKWVPRADVAEQITTEHAGLWAIAKQQLDELDTVITLTRAAQANLMGPNE